MSKWGNVITRIMKVNIENYSVKLKFSDGLIAVVSFKSIFSHPKGLAAEVLKGNMFDQCFIEHGALAWPNGLEFCPDAIRQLINEQPKKVA